MHIEQVQGSQQPHDVMIDGCSLSKSNQRTQGLASACAIKMIKLSSQRNDARHVGMQSMMLRMPMQLFAESESTSATLRVLKKNNML